MTQSKTVLIASSHLTEFPEVLAAIHEVRFDYIAAKPGMGLPGSVEMVKKADAILVIAEDSPSPDIMYLVGIGKSFGIPLILYDPLHTGAPAYQVAVPSETALSREDLVHLLARLPEKDETDSSTDQATGDTELVIEFDIPEAVGNKRVIAELTRVSLLADDLHRSLGGHGLTLKALEVYQASLVPERHNG